jgi:hypothetical protein
MINFVASTVPAGRTGANRMGVLTDTGTDSGLNFLRSRQVCLSRLPGVTPLWRVPAHGAGGFGPFRAADGCVESAGGGGDTFSDILFISVTDPSKGLSKRS